MVWRSKPIFFIQMHNEILDNADDKNFSSPSKIEKENVVCKDGFCSIQNHDESTKFDKDNISLFDPI